MTGFDVLLGETLAPPRIAYDAAARAWEAWFTAHPLPNNADLDARLADPETRAGFVAHCRAHGIYHLPTAEFVAALAAVLRRLPGPCVEVGAGRGDLARAVRAAGVPLIATDDGAWWPNGLPDDVARRDIDAALTAYEPATVFCVWPPRGTDWPDRFHAAPNVRAYLLIGATIPGMTGDAATWAAAPGWRLHALPHLAAFARCRLDADGARYTRAILMRRASAL